MINEDRNISVVGESGKEYYGKIYDHKNTVSTLSGDVVVCLSNTRWEDNHWQFNMRDIYRDDVAHALNHFKDRDDISHLILIPLDTNEPLVVDIIQDLKRRYIHK